MKKFLTVSIFILLLSFASIASYTENYDDMLIQCNMHGKNVPKVRDKHLCEKENFDDDFIYYIAHLKTDESGRLLLEIIMQY